MNYNSTGSISDKYHYVHFIEQGIEQGLKQGIVLGIEQGIKQSEEYLAKLINLLAKENRTDEIILCVNDKKYQKALMKEFGIL